MSDMHEIFITIFGVLAIMNLSEISSEIRKIRKLLERKDDDK